MTSILITGASGQQGGAIAKNLLRHRVPIRAMSRSLNKITHLKEMGAECVTGDLLDNTSIEKALAGIKTAYLVTTPYEKGVRSEVDQGINFINLAKKTGVEHIVYSSVAAADQKSGIPHFDNKLEVEEHLKKSGIPYTIIRPVFFMENFGSPWFFPAILQGKLVLPLSPNKPLQMICLDVIGEVGGKILSNPKEHTGKIYELMCDELSLKEAMDLVSRASGVKVTYEELPKNKAVDALGEDFARMFEWFEEEGFHYTKEPLKALGVTPTSFAEHLKTCEWIKQLKALAHA